MCVLSASLVSLRHYGGSTLILIDTTHAHTDIIRVFLKSLGFLLKWALTGEVSDHIEWVEKKWPVGQINSLSKSCASTLRGPGYPFMEVKEWSLLSGASGWSWREPSLLSCLPSASEGLQQC